jgi:serine/threonine protein kinase
MWDFMAKMIRFFAKMQKLGFNHRDIKPGNIMIKREGY